MADSPRFTRHMSDEDALMWHIEKDPILRSTIVAVALFDRPPDFERLRARIDLHEPDRLPDGRGTPTTFLGHARLGMPPYMMQLDVEIRAKRPQRAAGPFVSGFLVKGDMTVLENVRRAVIRATCLSSRRSASCIANIMLMSSVYSMIPPWASRQILTLSII